MKHYIVYSHGFGVEKTDRGLLSDIANSLHGYEHVLFDFNDIDPETNYLTVSPLNEQVRRLEEQLHKLAADGEEKTIDIVAHSQGCVVAALAEYKNVRSVICLTPPLDVNAKRIAERFRQVSGSVIDMSGMSKLARRDGTFTQVPHTYWESTYELDVPKLYTKLAEKVHTVFVVATEDEVLKDSDVSSKVPTANVHFLEGNHNFTNQYRQGICKKVAELLES